ncbi:Zinc/iron permease [Syncephalastrum racemosum]|uniref:Zinc/iron permease n=1 Tax=Syncephalastrum racemosum TaxID=13706 RepID=A0A1X2H5C8_SYNRA|nr:Zinc/iron permease [Syncephalastrum racemosum]
MHSLRLLGLAFLLSSFSLTIYADADDATNCSASAQALSSYNLSWHVGSIFIMMGVSFLGIVIPVATKFVSWFAVSPRLITCGKSFGVGVILATAFIHMLPPAFEKLTSPCLGHPWHEGYDAFPALFAMLAVLVMHLIEYFATTYLESHHGHAPALHSHHHPDLPVHHHHHLDNGSDTTVNEPALNETLYVHGHEAAKEGYQPADDVSINDTRRWLSTVLLELGILAHSVIIGITLGVSAQGEFTGLLIALCFHQFFEGFALGARIAEVNLINLRSAIGMSAFFMLTTPLGTAIGVGISSTYNPQSSAALLAQGIFDSLSAGILIYVSLVNLLASEMIYDERFKKMRKSTKITSFVCMYAGAAVMAIIGLWA